MQEHEMLYEYPTGQSEEHAVDVLASGSQEPVQIAESANEELVGDESADKELAGKEDALEERQEQRATLRLGRALATGLGLSFLACLSAIWFSGTLLSAPDQIVPVGFLQMVAGNRVLILCAPVICLVICYASLRALTADVMAVPEYLMDERQKMLRDQAHRSAFKVVKFASFLIPVGLILPHLPWFNLPASPAGPVAVHDIFVFRADRHMFWGNHRSPIQVFSVLDQSLPSAPLITPASMPEIVLAGGLLVLALILVFSALPMAVLAWKGRV